MQYSHCFTPEAELDYAEAVAWYSAISPALGFRAYLAIEEAIRLLVSYPLGYQVLYDETRRKLVKDFPYAIYFELRGDQVVIMHIRHQHSDHQTLVGNEE